MSHVQIKLIAAALFGVAVTACGDADKKKAEALYIMAETAAQEGDYERAIQLVDSIDSCHARQVDTRRKAMHVRARAIEGHTVKAIADVGNRWAQLTLRADSLQARLERVDNPLEPYYIPAGQKRIVGSNGLEARMSPDGIFYMISSLRNPRINHTYITVSADGYSARTAEVAHDGERNDRSLGYEVIHYMMPECDSVGAFIASHPGSEISVTYGGGSRTYTETLTREQADGIATLYRSAVNARELHRTSLEKAHLERQLELARKHAASTFPE